MSVGETDDYVDDDDTSIYRWRIKMTINMFQEQVCSTNETFVSFLQSIFLQPYLRLFFSSGFSSSLLLPFYLPFPFDSSVTVSYSLIQFRPSSPPPSARSLDFHDVRKPGHNCNRPQPPTQLSMRRRKTVSSRSFLIAAYFSRTISFIDYLV